MTTTLPLPDSGYRSEFATGAVRDASVGKGLPCQIPPIAIRKLAWLYEKGGEKYGMGNWRKGIPISRFYDSMCRHLLAVAEGKEDEDHIAAVLWNAAGYAWTEDQIKLGTLPRELNDMP